MKKKHHLADSGHQITVVMYLITCQALPSELRAQLICKLPILADNNLLYIIGSSVLLLLLLFHHLYRKVYALPLGDSGPYLQLLCVSLPTETLVKH